SLLTDTIKLGVVVDAQQYGLKSCAAQNRAHINPRLANTYPGSSTPASPPADAVETGMIAQAISRRIENTALAVREACRIAKWPGNARSGQDASQHQRTRPPR